MSVKTAGTVKCGSPTAKGGTCDRDVIPGGWCGTKGHAPVAGDSAAGTGNGSAAGVAKAWASADPMVGAGPDPVGSTFAHVQEQWPEACGLALEETLRRFQETSRTSSMVRDASEHLAARLAPHVNDGDTFTVDGETFEVMVGKERDRWDDDITAKSVLKRALAIVEDEPVPAEAVAAAAREILAAGGWRSDALVREGLDPGAYSEWVPTLDENGEQVYSLVPTSEEPSSPDDDGWREQQRAALVDVADDPQQLVERIVELDRLRSQINDVRDAHAARAVEQIPHGEVHFADGVAMFEVARAGRRQGWDHDEVWKDLTSVVAGSAPGGGKAKALRDAVRRTLDVTGAKPKKSALKSGLLPKEAHYTVPGRVRIVPESD